MEARKLGDRPPALPGEGETLGLGGARLDILMFSKGLKDCKSTSSRGWLESSNTVRGACNDV